MVVQRWLLDGRVQGVGFRPFVYRLATGLGLSGTVRNLGSKVEIIVRGEPAQLALLQDNLLHHAPRLARPHWLSCEDWPHHVDAGFAILASAPASEIAAGVPPDCFTCPDCLAELADQRNRRYRYPFINCSQCGPRYTLIRALPYDRSATTMASFVLCPQCQAEYLDPADRRFHAEPLACPDCGPQLSWQATDGSRSTGETALASAVAAIRAGWIIAVKGVGGYHLMCDATQPETLHRLRQRKQRRHKPFALMCPWQGADGLDHVRKLAELTDLEAGWLTDPVRPLLWLDRRPDSGLPDQLAPGLASVGVMLPYSPLHQLLLQECNRPLVATSANRSGEPVVFDNADAEQRLTGIADGWLHHDRVILRPAEDSVWRRAGRHAMVIRAGRGMAPLEFRLPFRLPAPVLAVGGQLKVTVALGFDDRLVVSPHLGDMDSPSALDLLAETVTSLQQLYAVRASTLVCDAHPDYATSRWAAGSGLPVVRIWHHHAHASALALEHADVWQWLVLVWDGSGLGSDGSLWGGESLLGRPGNWQRIASLRPFFLPGGERAAREPWRCAAALHWQAGLHWQDAGDDAALLHDIWQRRINSPASSSAGRLFDAAAAMLGGMRKTTFEGQAALWLEQQAVNSGQQAVNSGQVTELPWRHDESGMHVLDWAPLLGMLVDASRPVAVRAAGFHASLVDAVLRQAEAQCEQHAGLVVGLAGGVFQNRWLVEGIVAGLQAKGIPFRLAGRLPVNDGGLAAGQIMEAGSLEHG